MVLVSEIRDYLKNNCITQKEFAERVGVSVGTLQSWLHRGIKPSGEIMRKMAVLMDIDTVQMAYHNIDKSECSTTLGYCLSLVRDSLGYTTKEMGLILDISPVAYSLWESGATQPQPRQIPRIADVLDIDEDTAYCWAYSRKANPVSYEIVHNSHEALYDRFQSVGKVI